MGRPEFNNYTFYKFSCKTEDINCCYVGSTANFLARQRNHKYSTNNTNSKDYNLKLYETIRANGGWENWTMSIIGEAENISLKDARIKEEEYRVNLKAELNMQKAYRSEECIKENNKVRNKKHYEANKEHKYEYNKKYVEINKEKIKENAKARREANKEHIKENAKTWREANKEKIKEYNKQYNLKKKEIKSLEN